MGGMDGVVGYGRTLGLDFLGKGRGEEKGGWGANLTRLLYVFLKALLKL